MVKVLIIRDKTRSFNGGIKRHCSDLKELMSNYKDLTIAPIEDIPSKYLKLFRKSVFRSKELNSYIIQNSCDVVHIHGFMSLGVIQAIKTAYKLKKKIIYSPHFHPFEYLKNPILGKLFFYIFFKPLLHKIDTIITINKEDTLFFRNIHPKVVQIPHWTTHTNLLHSNFPKRKNMILFVGRNDDNKGLEHLYHLPPYYEVHCVTKGPIERSDFILHENINDYELTLLYQQASLVTIPSKYEAFSLVALEALSNHTPIVLSNHVRIADYLSGNNGYCIFKYHNYNDFNYAIKKVMEMKNIDFNQLLLPFNPKDIQEKYYQIYNN